MLKLLAGILHSSLGLRVNIDAARPCEDVAESEGSGGDIIVVTGDNLGAASASVGAIGDLSFEATTCSECNDMVPRSDVEAQDHQEFGVEIEDGVEVEVEYPQLSEEGCECSESESGGTTDADEDEDSEEASNAEPEVEAEVEVGTEVEAGMAAGAAGFDLPSSSSAAQPSSTATDDRADHLPFIEDEHSYQIQALSSQEDGQPAEWYQPDQPSYAEQEAIEGPQSYDTAADGTAEYTNYDYGYGYGDCVDAAGQQYYPRPFPPQYECSLPHPYPNSYPYPCSDADQYVFYTYSDAVPLSLPCPSYSYAPQEQEQGQEQGQGQGQYAEHQYQYAHTQPVHNGDMSYVNAVLSPLSMPSPGLYGYSYDCGYYSSDYHAAPLYYQ
jgi:hypothetical protein